LSSRWVSQAKPTYIFAPFLGRFAIFLHQVWELEELKPSVGLKVLQIILPSGSFWWRFALSRKGKSNKSWVRGNSWWDRLKASRVAGGLSFLYSHRITESQNSRVWKGPLWVI